MAVLKKNYKVGDTFPPQDLNLICDTINNDGVSLSTVTAGVATTSATLNTTTAIANTNQNSMTSIQSKLSTDLIALNNMQTTLDAINNRLTVLEGAGTPPPAVPTAPTAVIIGNITNTTIQVSWTAPTGTAATSYTVRSAPTGTGAYTDKITVSTPTVTATITGLTQATGYDIVVVSKNAAGPGGQSAPLTNIRTTSSFTPSPANTTIPSATQIVMNDGGIVTVVGGVIFLNGSLMGDTNSVILVLKAADGRIYQEITTLEWWYWDQTILDWVFTSDPRVVAPPSGGPTPPAAAAAVGYIIRTYGPDVTVGSNWFVVDGTNVQNSDGSMTTFGTGGFNANLQTAVMLGGGNFSGTSFGGGAYFEATMKWSGTTTQSGGGWPAFWSNDSEMQADAFGAAAQWPGQPGGTLVWFEPDFLEAFTEGGYGTALHNWYSNDGGASIGDVQAMPPAFTFPAGFNHNAYHKYGWLWVPATTTTQGFAAAYIDGVEWQRVRWNYASGTVPYPPSLSGGVISTGGLLDRRHLYLILGSGPNNPLTVQSVEVWQKSAAGNLGAGTPVGGGGGGGGGGGTAPARAAAVGYTTQTFGPSVILSGTGQNWRRFEGAGGSGTFTNNSDGSVTIIPPGGSGDGHQWDTASFTGGYMGFTGRGFGGGGYFVARMKWAAGAGISPAWWSNDIEGQTGFGVANSPVQWPGQGGDYNLWFEPDFMEAGTNDFGSSVWQWYGSASGPQGRQPLAARTSVGNTNVFHDYGCLWVPATSGHGGYMAFDVDGVEYGRASWPFRPDRNTLPGPPPTPGNDAGSNITVPTMTDIDWRHLYLILGSDTGFPVTVASVSVWQSSGSFNISG